MGLCLDPPAIVTELCERGSLAGVLAAARQDAAVAMQLTWPRRLQMAVDAALGMLVSSTGSQLVGGGSGAVIVLQAHSTCGAHEGANPTTHHAVLLRSSLVHSCRSFCTPGPPPSSTAT